MESFWSQLWAFIKGYVFPILGTVYWALFGFFQMIGGNWGVLGGGFIVLMIGIHFSGLNPSAHGTVSDLGIVNVTYSEGRKGSDSLILRLFGTILDFYGIALIIHGAFRVLGSFQGK